MKFNAYDSNGNCTSVTVGTSITTLSYDDSNRVTGITYPSAAPDVKMDCTLNSEEAITQSIQRFAPTLLWFAIRNSLVLKFDKWDNVKDVLYSRWKKPTFNIVMEPVTLEYFELFVLDLCSAKGKTFGRRFEFNRLTELKAALKDALEWGRCLPP